MAGPVSFNSLFDETGPGRAELDELVKSVAALSRGVKALGKNLDSDGQRIGAGLATITNQTQQLRERTTQLTLTTEAERAALAGLGTQVAQLAQQQQQQIAALAGQVIIRKSATEADNAATSALRTLQTELKAAYATDDTARIQKAALAVQQYKRETDQLNKAVRGANSELTAIAGSYNRLSIDTQKLGERIRALPDGFDSTSAAAVKMKKEFADNTQKLKDFDRELNQNFREVGSYAKGIIEATRALNGQKVALTGELSALKMQANATHLSAEQQRQLTAEIQRTEAELGKVSGELRAYGTTAGNAGKSTLGLKAGVGELGQFFTASFLSITALIGAISGTFEANAKYSDQLADVRKTTGLTAEATDQLAENLKKVDTRTTLSGLLDIAKVGGQLGIAGKDIEAFTKSIDIAVQALGDDFSGGAEQIATELGKISTVFRKELGEDQASNITRIGSAVNQLGAEGAATAPFLTDVALRTGAVASSARLGLKDVLAYAATLQETGFTAEVSGTSLNRLFNTLSTKSKEAYEIAKLANPALTLKDFKRLVNTDFQGAITAFLRGLREGGTSTTKFNALLGTLKLQSGEAKAVITTLAQNVELLGEKQATANEQLKEGTSLGAEAAIKNDTLAGSWAKLKNDVGNFFTSGTAGNVIKFFVDYVRTVPGALAGAGLRGIGDGFTYLRDKINGVEQPQKDFAAAAVVQVTALENQAAAQQKLVDSYTTLAATANRTEAQRLELAKTKAELIAKFGTAEAEVIQKGINQQLLAAESHKQVLRQDLANYDKSTGELLTKAATFEQQLDAQTKGFTAQQLATVQAVAAARLAYETKEGKPFPFKGSQNAELEQAIAASLTLQRTEKQLGVQQATRTQIVAALASITEKATGDTRAEAGATDDSTEATKKKKVAVADLAKEEAALAKQRLDERLADLTRQADNPANTEAVRIDALKKAAEVRVGIAKVERDELIREAAAKFKGQVNGEQALGVATTRLTEAFSAKRLGIERETNKALLTLHNALLDQLAATDKLVIEAELAGLDLVVNDEQRSYDERQQAALDASARRIELIQLEAETERRAAKGNAELLRTIQAKEDNATAAELRKTRRNNADFANDELAQEYAQRQLALEKSRAAGAITERAYTEQSRLLDERYHTLRQENFKDDATKQKEATDEEIANIKRRTDFAIAEEQRLRALKGQLINEALDNVRGFSDAYFTIESNNNAARAEDLRAAKETELKVAGENLELKAQIEEKYRQRELEAKRKQAKLDRAQALFTVALNTAQAVTSVLSTGGGTRYADFGISAGVLAALVIAQGLAQTTAILAKPLPAYFKGRRTGPAEMAVVAERGPELIGQASTGFRVVAQEGVTRLAAGDRVYTAPETREVMRDHELVAGRLVARRQQADPQQQAQALQGLGTGLTQSQAAEARATEVARLETDRLIRAWHERPELRLTDEGLRRFTRRGDTETEEVNSRYKGRG